MADTNVTATIISSLAGLCGTIAGGLITYWATRTQKASDRTEENRAAISGIAAELEAYVELVTWRNHSTTVNGLIASLSQGNNIPLSNWASALNGGSRDFFPLFFSNLERIGAFGEEAYDIAKFHTQLAGIYATLESVKRGHFDQSTIPQKIALLEQERDLWENTLRLGRNIVERLKARP